MKRKPATLEQKAWIMRVKTCPCIICNPEWFEGDVLPEYYHGEFNSEGDHVTDARGRLGHDYIIPLCYEHHRGNKGYSGNKSIWGKSSTKQLELCKKVWAKFGREWVEPLSKIAPRRF
jgi:hypothetical protein